MDFLSKKTYLRSVNTLNTSVNHKKYSLTADYSLNEIKWIQNKICKPTRHTILDDIMKPNHRTPRSEIELFVGCGDGLYRVCAESQASSNNVSWKRVAERGDAFYQHLMKETQKENCLSDLGIGKEPIEIPSCVQKKIYNQMRPQNSTIATQAKVLMTELGSQTYWTGLNTSDHTTQASVDTSDFGIQVEPEVTSTGTQADTVSQEVSSQTTSPVKDEVFDSKIQSQVTLEVNFAKAHLNGQNIEFTTMKADSVNLKLSKEDSDTIMEIVKRTMAKKSNILSDLECHVIDGDLTPSPVQAGPAGPQTFQKLRQLPPKCMSGDVRIDAAAASGSVAGGCLGNKPEGDVLVRYHRDLPIIPFQDRYLSKTSPFSKYGYTAGACIPKSLDGLKIPVVEQRDICFKKGENGSELLGNGSFGYVYLAKHVRHISDVCVKEYDRDTSTIYDIYKEAKMLIYLQNTKFVPQCLGLMESLLIEGDLSLVQECYANGYTLRMLLRNRPATFIKRKWISVCYQLFWGLKTIHERQVLLNDIKTDNILVDYKSEDIMNNVRFIDLGLASFRRGHKFSNDPTYLEQFEQYAPEVRQGCYSTPASDLYSVGHMVDKISETIGIIEIDPIAEMCTRDDPNNRPSCQLVLEKLEDILENV